MTALLDACVLYPPVVRDVLLGAAERGAFAPVWSARILEEWARAARKEGPLGEMEARGAIALLRAAWPGADMAPAEGVEARLWLPDPADVHVLAAAIAGGADTIVTFNTRDFPHRELAAEGVGCAHPDRFLYDLWTSQRSSVERAVAAARDRQAPTAALRAFLKRAGLPRLGKVLAQEAPE